ncbi:MAG: YibE/F family protein [Candidatus Pacebacteria bacterium]|nr:YibE/F family protein [Candidatus Paceibacterota bacterium]
MNRWQHILIVGMALCVIFSAGNSVQAQEFVPDVVTTVKARVTAIISQESRNVPGTDVASTYQQIEAEILEGDHRGNIVVIDNDYLNLNEGDVFYARHTVNALDAVDRYSVSDPYRMPILWVFIGLFVLCVVMFGGKQGLRGLIALIGSFAFIFYLLLPGVMNGYSPVLVSIGISSLIIILGSYVTHGFNKVTSSAVFGMIVTILFTGALAYASIYFGKLTGFASEEAVYLNLNTGGSIDFAGLLLGGMLIGLLGVLYDAAIGQAVSVDELRQVGPHLSKGVIFRRALRIGREHIGALVNTLAIAYVGAALPLLLLFYNSSASATLLINQEIFATEILRTMVGSIGLVLAVPITTIIAVSMLVRPKVADTTNPAVIARERQGVEESRHHH